MVETRLFNNKAHLTTIENTMPTVLRHGPYRFFFYSSDRFEPQHVHVERDNNVAKFWLDPIRMEISGNFKRAEIRDIERVIVENQTRLLESWDAYFYS